MGMKKVILLCFFFLFFLISAPYSLAEELEETATLSAEEQTLTENKVEYALPYPGILPDSPFYFLKTARDKIVSFLISDSIKHAEFNILTADKRLSAGFYLANQRKFSLAEETISKGENYMEKAAAQIEEAKKQGIATKDILKKLNLSLEKHSETILELKKIAPKNLRVNFQNLNRRVEDIKFRVNENKAQI